MTSSFVQLMVEDIIHTLSCRRSVSIHFDLTFAIIPIFHDMKLKL